MSISWRTLSLSGYRKRLFFSFIKKRNIVFLDKYLEEKILYEDFRLLYRGEYGKYPNLKKPHNLNEKLLWLSFYWRDPLKTECADKYKCREYVTQHCGLPESLLVPLLGVWNKAEDIDFDTLPNQFVLKCNHGCGYNIIVKDKESLDTTLARKKLNQWLSEDYAGNVAEIHYKDINPHIIICEQYIPAIGDNSSVIDYKLFCFNGEPAFFFVAYDRGADGKATFCTFSVEWEQLFYTIDEKKAIIPKPTSCNDMLKYAGVLSKKFPFVRVDFYDMAGKAILGELTFTPRGNLLTYFSQNVITNYGKVLQLPPKYKEI